jgi:hypothetical protein
MSDDELFALAQHRLDQVNRLGATHGGCQQMRDIFPAVMARLREKIEIIREMVPIQRIGLSKPGAWERMAATPRDQTSRPIRWNFPHSLSDLVPPP